jgi:signal transduction histidine kinase
MSFEGHSAGIALLCDHRGIVREVIRDDLGLTERGAAGWPLGALLDAGSAEKAVNFIAALGERQAAFDWELNAQVGGEVTSLHFAGGASEQGLLIVGAKTVPEMTRFYDEMMRINNEQMNRLRAVLKSAARQAEAQAERESEITELTRLNNEFATLQRELAKKNRELERLVEQMNQFLGMAAHDLRNPLGVILMLGKFLRKEAAEAENDRQAQFIDKIISSTEFMLRLVNNLLDISKIEAGKLELDLRPADLASIVRQNVELNQILSEKKGIKLSVACDDDLPEMLIDAPKFEQVLNNLISNAVKFSPANDTVEISVYGRDGEAIVAVKDNGPGIAPDEAERIFHPFEQARQAGSAGEKGTGLGLAIAQKIVAGHRGRIWVDGRDGGGAAFYVSLPVVAAKPLRLAQGDPRPLA